MTNPLVAQAPQEGSGFTQGTGDNGWATGISIAESAMDTFNGFKEGNWIEGGLGVVGLAADAASMAIDPFGTLMSSAASFLMEHVQPLKDMLDWLAGDPPVIESYSTTWTNVATELGKISEDYATALKSGTEGWTGAAADAYRNSAAEQSDAITGAASAAGSVGTVVGVMGMVVAFVREMVRDLIADLIGKLIAWVLEAVFSLGFGTPVIVAQAITAIGKWAARIAKLVQKLLDTIKKVSPMLKRLVEIFEKIMKVLGKLAGKATGLDVLGTKIDDPGFLKKLGRDGPDLPSTSHADAPTSPSSTTGTSTSPSDTSPASRSDADSPSSSRPADSTAPSSTTPSSTTTPASPSTTSPSSSPGSPSPSPSPSTPSPSPAGRAPSGTPSPSSAGHAPGGSRSPGGHSPSSTSPAPGGHAPGGSAPAPGGHAPGGHSSSPGGHSPGSSSPGGHSPGNGSPAPSGHNTGSAPSPGGHSPGNGSPAPGGHSPGGPSPAPSGHSPGGSSPGPAGHSPSPSPTGHGSSTSPAGSAPAPARVDQTHSSATEAPSRVDQPHTSPRDAGPSQVPQQGSPAPGGSAPHSGGQPGGSAPNTGSPRPGGSGWTGTPGHRGDLSSGTPQGRTPDGTRPQSAGPPHAGPPQPRPPQAGPPPYRPAQAGPPYGGPPHAGPPHAGPPQPRPAGPPHAGPPQARPSGPPQTRPAGPAHTNPPHTGPSQPRPNTGPPQHAPQARGPQAGAPPHHAPAAPHQHGPNTPPHHDPNTPDPTHHTPDQHRPDVDEAHARHGETTPAGISHHRGDPAMGDLPSRVPNDPRYFTADVHITPDGRARIGNHTYSPEEYGDLLRRNGWDGRTPIRLIGCDAGSNDFAKRLSAHTDAPVLAPTKPAWTDSSGRVYTSDAEVDAHGNRRPKIPPNGEWETHSPDGTRVKSSEDGFAPGTHDHDKTDLDPDGARDRAADSDGTDPDGDPDGGGGDPDGAAAPKDWRDVPGGTTGMSPREKIADAGYVKNHYKEYHHADGRVELRVNANRSPDADGMEPPPVDLENGQPKFKQDRPPAESLGYDADRSQTVHPRRDDTGSTGTDGTGPDSPNADSPGADGTSPDAPEGGLTGDYRGADDWRRQDYDEIDTRMAERERGMEEVRTALDEHPKGSQERSDAYREQTSASEDFGEQVSAHAVRERVHDQFSRAYPDADVEFRPRGGGDFDPAHTSREPLEVVDANTGRVLGEVTPRHLPGSPGHSNFDQVWEVDHRDGRPPDYVVHEAKAPNGQLSERKIEGPGGVVRVVQQGHPDYFDDTLRAMTARGGPDADLARDLSAARLDNRLDYLEVRARVDQSGGSPVFDGWEYRPYNGYDYQPRLPLTED